VKLERPELIEAFRGFAEGGHGVVIGAPGVGKTNLLKKIVRDFRATGDSVCLFLPVDRIPLESDSDLRAELQAAGDLLLFLERQAQGRHGYLIVDALDAVRGDRPRMYILGLVRRVLARLSDSWTVILSMRTYDALRSVELDEIFPSALLAVPNQKYQLPKAICRHFYVPPLENHEIDVAREELPWLGLLWDAGSADLRELLRIPLNLWLLERLFERGAEVDDVSFVHSEVQLLNLYWRQRVWSGPLAPDQRWLVSRAGQAMIHRRTLWTRTDDVYEPGANEGWIALHSSEVLEDANENGTRVSFAHNVLFDYAVSVEILEDDVEAVMSFLREEPDRALFLRPTLNYFFSRLWFTNRQLFWKMFWTLLAAEEPHIRLVGQVLTPGIIAGEARSLGDIKPILSSIEEGGAHAENAVLLLLQAIRTHQVTDDNLWPAFAASAARRLSRIYSWTLARFISELLEREQKQDTPNFTVRDHISAGAREHLRLALASNDPVFEHLTAVWLVGVVARTYNVDPGDARNLFEKILARIPDPGTPVDLIYRLANATKNFWNDDPQLAASVYAQTFAHVELSDESTHMGGIVVTLTSNRRQDFEATQYVLIADAPLFLRDQPDAALPGLVQAATCAAMMRENIDDGAPEQIFEFHGKQVRFRQDHSHFWDIAGATGRDNALKILDIIFGYLAELPAGSPQLSDAVDAIAENASSALIWRGLLKAGYRDVRKYAPLLHELISAKPIISSPETVYEAAAFLAVAAPMIDDEDLLKVENALAELGVQDHEQSRHWARRLAAQIPEDRPLTDAVRDLRADAQTDPEASSNRPLISMSTSWEPYEAEDWLRDEGIETDSPTARRLLDETEGLHEFASRFVSEQTVPNDAVAAIITTLAEGLQLLQAEDGLPAALLDVLWARIGEAAAVAVRADSLDELTTGILRRALLACASGAAPRPTEDDDERFTFPAWSPAARNAAAQGLPRLFRYRADDETIMTVRALAADPVPSVRFLLVRALPLLAENEEAFWEILAHYAANEGNGLVLQEFGRALAAVASPDREGRVTETLDLLLRRIQVTQISRSVANDDRIGALIVGLAIARDNEWAAEQLAQTLQNAPPAYLATLVLHVLSYASYNLIADPNRRRIAEAALKWLPEIIDRVRMLLRHEADREQPGGADRDDTVRDLFNVLDHIVSRLYFQSGIHSARSGDQSMTHVDICLFFTTVQPYLRQLGEMAGGTDATGLPARTAHHFIELLRGSISCDPAEVLHLARLAVDGARGTGYSFDPMAAQEVTAIVEILLADHREAVRSGPALEDLIHVLDVFVESGWPEAQRLVWRLEELFR
jgi:hypothetical protein